MELGRNSLHRSLLGDSIINDGKMYEFLGLLCADVEGELFC